MTRPLDEPSSDGRRRLETLALVLVVVLPIIVLIVALARRTWYPTGDLAQAELRMRSLPDHPPLLGAAGRIVDDAGRQGNHPGPLMFWATWPLYALLGRSAWAFEAATALVNLAWISVAMWLVRRRANLAVSLWFAAVALVLIGGFGLDALSQPWNPWVALLPFTVLMLVAWRSLDGWIWAPVLAVGAASYAIQGHAGYAPVALPLVVVSTVAPLVVAWRRGRERMLPALLTTGGAIAVGLLAWSGPFLDVVRNQPSNVAKLMDNFASPDEAPLGLADGLQTTLRALSPVGAWVSGRVVIDGSVIPGLLLVFAWAVVAGAVAWNSERRRRHAPLLQLDAIVGLTLLMGTFAVTRIFGAPYLYVFRWVAVLAAFLVFTLGWGIAVLAVEHRTAVAEEDAPDAVSQRIGRPLTVAAVALLLFSAFTSVRLARQEIPYPYSWRMEQVLAPQVASDLDRAPRYLVDWDDPVYLGGLGFGLLLDLERRGYDVGARPQYSAAVEPHRVRCPGDYDAVLTVVTGPRAIARWKAKPGTELLARVGSDRGYDYDATFARLRRVLARDGSATAPDRLEQLLTLVLLNPGASQEARDLAAELVRHGVPSAVFLQAPAPIPAPVPLEGPYEPCWR